MAADKHRFYEPLIFIVCLVSVAVLTYAFFMYGLLLHLVFFGILVSQSAGVRRRLFCSFFVQHFYYFFLQVFLQVFLVPVAFFMYGSTQALVADGFLRHLGRYGC